MGLPLKAASPLTKLAARFKVGSVLPCHGLAELNEEQREAVESTDGALLVLSGAGTGKTRTITHRIAHIISERGVRPNHVLAVTFTNRAAEEMKGRVTELLDVSGVRDSTTPVLCTFHSLGARLLRRYIEHLDIGGITRGFSIYDESDAQRLLASLIKEAGLNAETLSPRLCSDQISIAKNSGMFAETFAHTVPPRDPLAADVAHIYSLYQASLRKANAVDLDDLLLLSVHLLRTRPPVRERLADHFKYILVDEYQDTNALQLELIKLLSSVHGNVCVVGDEDQALYSWRGADITNVLNFQKHFPQARIVRLEENYRSTPQILTAASSVIEHNQERLGKRLWTRQGPGLPVRLYEAPNCDAEAEYVADRIAELLATAPATLPYVGVLYRTNSQSRLIEEALRQRMIPVSISGGISFYARSEIKDVMAYAKLAANHEDRIAFERAIARPSRGIGEKAIANLYALATARNVPLWQVITSEVDAFEAEVGGAALFTSPAPESGLSRNALEALGTFYHLIEFLTRLGNTSDVSSLVNAVIEEGGYGEMLRKSKRDDAKPRLNNLGELIRSAGEYDGRADGLRDFIDHTALASTSEDEPGSATAPVVLSTVHAAKGLEFPHVFFVGMEDHLFPHTRSVENIHGIEEERRLCYVALTRAQQELTITYTQRRRTFNRWRFCEPSRFLSEVPTELLLVDHEYVPTTVPRRRVRRRADDERVLQEA